MHIVLLLISLLVCGCGPNEQSQPDETDLKLVAAYGQSTHPYAEFKPTLIDDTVVYFDGRHVRLAPIGHLINYDVIDSPDLRTKPEYFNKYQAYAVTDQHFLVLLDIGQKSVTTLTKLQGPVLCSPSAIADDKIFVQYLNNTVQCLDRQTYQVIWERSLPDVTSNYYVGHFKPLFDDSRVYFSIPGGLFFALDINTGETIWTYSSQVAERLTSHNVADFLSPKSLTFLGEEQILLMNSDGYVHCLSFDTGLMRWLKKADSRAKLIVNNGQVYTMTVDHTLVAFDENMADPLWTLNLENTQPFDIEILNNQLWIAFNDSIWIVNSQGQVANKIFHHQRKPHLISNFTHDNILIGDESKNVYTMVN